MSFILLASITICLFATGGSLYLLWRLGDWHLAFLAAMTALVGTQQAIRLFESPLAWTISFPGPVQDFPGLMVSVMVWLAIFFLERMIRERMRAEETLRESDERFRDMAEIASDWIWELDADLNFSYVSDTYFRATVRSPEEIIGKHRAAMTPESHSEEWTKHLEDLRKHLPFSDFEYSRKLRDGSIMWISSSGKPMFDDDGTFKGYRSVGRDITERKRADEKLAETETQLRVALDNMPGGMALEDGDRNYVLFNSQYSELHDYPEGFLKVGMAAREEVRFQAERGDFGPGNKDDLVEQVLAVYQSGKAASWERTFPNGRTLRFNVAPTPEGGYVRIATDITERKRAEEALRESERSLREAAQSAEAARERAEIALAELKATQQNLIQAEKMASLGQLTAGIAHEIKNPLNFINNFAEISGELLGELKEEIEPAVTTLEEDDQEEVENLITTLSGNLGKIHEHGQRADRIVKGMLLHSRGGADERALTDVNHLAEEALNLAYHGARAQDQQFNVTLERDLDPDVGSIDIVPQEITRVLLNLLGNGFYATRMRRQATQDGAYEPTVGLATRDLGDGIEIRVRDNGTGMSPDVIEKLFTPFFTTKPPGEGTGLGLSLSYDIVVQQHNGRFTVDSKEGQYSEFIITLPRQQSGEAAAPAEGGSA